MARTIRKGRPDGRHYFPSKRARLGEKRSDRQSSRRELRELTR